MVLRVGANQHVSLQIPTLCHSNELAMQIQLGCNNRKYRTLHAAENPWNALTHFAGFITQGTTKLKS